MHALPVLKQACLDAFDTEDEPGNPALFFSIADPGSVLELGEFVETRITDEEVQALHRVLADLGFLHSPNRTGAGCDEIAAAGAADCGRHQRLS
jgi:hypothetical protein